MAAHFARNASKLQIGKEQAAALSLNFEKAAPDATLNRRAKYTFLACIELGYPAPQGSDVLTELAKCSEHYKDALA